MAIFLNFKTYNENPVCLYNSTKKEKVYISYILFTKKNKLVEAPNKTFNIFKYKTCCIYKYNT